MQDIPALAEHLANMVTASDTPRYRSVLADNIRFIERELTTALTSARAQGAAEERERLAKLAEGERPPKVFWGDGFDSTGRSADIPLAAWLRFHTGEE